MEKYFVYIKAAFALVVGFVTNLLGGWDATLSLLVSLVVADIVTGVIYAVIGKKVSSTEMRMGIVRKLLIFVVIFVAFQVDKAIVDIAGSPIVIFDMECYIRTLFIIYACLEEGISLIENLANIGVPFPKAIKEVLVQVSEFADASLPKAIVKFIKDKFGIDISGNHGGSSSEENK